MKLSPLPVLVLTFLCACGGTAPPAAPAAVTSAVAPVAPAASPPTATVAAAAPSAAPTAAPSAAPTAAPSATPTAAPSVIISLTPGAVDIPVPTGPAAIDEAALPPLSADQKAFVTRQLLGTEVVFLTVTDASATCASVAAKAAPAKGARMAEMRVLWKTGYYDFSNRMAEAKLATYQGTFWLKEDATQGGIQVRSAPKQQGATGRLHLKASRPGSAQSMDTEVEVTVCTPIAPPK